MSFPEEEETMSRYQSCSKCCKCSCSSSSSNRELVPVRGGNQIVHQPGNAYQQMMSLPNEGVIISDLIYNKDYKGGFLFSLRTQILIHCKEHHMM